MKLTIHNETDWRGDDLRRIFRAGLVAAGATDDREIWVWQHRRRGRFSPEWTRGQGEYGGWSGDRYIQGGRIKMWVPRPTWIEPLIDGEAMTVRAIAQVFEHEVMHTLGMTHREMARDLRHCLQAVPWSTGLRLRPKGAASRSAAGSSGR